MAAVAVIPHITTTNIPDASAARKRRRDILSSQRQALDESSSSPVPEDRTVMSSSFSVVSGDDGSSRKARRVSDCSNSGKAARSKKKKPLDRMKKPQMKYDPDVPMSKEDAAVWRKEQRRKRNRESAALSRQRQRDKIGDLEVEIDDWKIKVESIMKRIKQLEDESGLDSSRLIPGIPVHSKDNEDAPEQSLEFEIVSDDDGKESKFVSPPTSPGPSPPPEDTRTVVDTVVDQVLMGIGTYEQGFTDNMISRHATS